MSEILANFGCLDELTQVIYQGIYKFVVLSTVSDDKWNIYVGLSGSEGRWWRGCWTEKDIHRLFVCILFKSYPFRWVAHGRMDVWTSLSRDTYTFLLGLKNIGQTSRVLRRKAGRGLHQG